MIILQDTREQRPLDFSKFRNPVRVVKLETGDYSIEGYEKILAVERKSVNDLVSTLYRARKRFSAELERMRAMKYKVIVVEGTLRDIYNHRYVSEVSPNAVVGLLNYIRVNTGVEIWFCDDPVATAWVLESFFREVVKKETKDAAAGDTERKATEGGAGRSVDRGKEGKQSAGSISEGK